MKEPLESSFLSPDESTDPARTQWLLKYEPWLRVLARQEMHRRLASKFDPSDVVQQTMMAAWQAWDQLEAEDEPHRLAWLRQILAHQLAHQVRHYEGTAKRSIEREQSLQESLDQSAARLDAMIPARDPSPSSQAVASEQRAELARALEQLPDDYRQVLFLRNLEELSHAEIARRMNRSEAAVRMLWLRALTALGQSVAPA